MKRIKCCVLNCGNTTKNTNLKFHRIPECSGKNGKKHLERRNEIIKNLGGKRNIQLKNKNGEVRKDLRYCSAHIDETSGSTTPTTVGRELRKVPVRHSPEEKEPERKKRRIENSK